MSTSRIFKKLLADIAKLPPLPTAVVHPCAPESLRGAILAKREGLIEPVLVGPQAKIHLAAKTANISLNGCTVVPTEHSHAAADAAVALAREGRVQCLMKGSLHTDELMGAVVHADKGLRTAR